MRFGRRDSTHAEIRDELRALGADVIDLGDVGDNVTDLLVGLCGRDFQVEAKGPKGKLSEGQRKHFETWRGQKPILLRSRMEAREWLIRTRHDLIGRNDQRLLA